MNSSDTLQNSLLEKIRSLPSEKLGEVIDFVDFLLERNQNKLSDRAATKLSEEAFAKVWDNSEDAEYDQL